MNCVIGSDTNKHAGLFTPIRTKMPIVCHPIEKQACHGKRALLWDYVVVLCDLHHQGSKKFGYHCQNDFLHVRSEFGKPFFTISLLHVWLWPQSFSHLIKMSFSTRMQKEKKVEPSSSGRDMKIGRSCCATLVTHDQTFMKMWNIFGIWNLNLI